MRGDVDGVPERKADKRERKGRRWERDMEGGGTQRSRGWGKRWKKLGEKEDREEEEKERQGSETGREEEGGENDRKGARKRRRKYDQREGLKTKCFQRRERARERRKGQGSWQEK